MLKDFEVKPVKGHTWVGVAQPNYTYTLYHNTQVYCVVADGNSWEAAKATCFKWIKLYHEVWG